MGLFSNLFNKKKDNVKEDETSIFYTEQDVLMKKATVQAQEHFKYFWRELYWEYRRIVPGHDFAMIKIPFQQQIQEQMEPVVEHMWINEIHFDGFMITGVLVNDPNELTNVVKGDIVTVKISDLSDWMISIQGKIYGGFTIQAIRSGMNPQERKHHDDAWGLDFGGSDEVLVVHQQKEYPEHLIEHPMSKNMETKMKEFLTDNPDEITAIDEDGLTLLHKEAIAGNKTTVEVLLTFGADITLVSKQGMTALAYAKAMQWEHLISVLS